MICESTVCRYCCEDPSKIENYDKAVADKTQTWDIHHRGEILPCGRYSRDTLKKFGLYYNRPASELIFLPPIEHQRLHSKGIPLSAKTKSKLSVAAKKHLADPRNHPMYGKHFSEESKAKNSASHKGRVPWNKGKRGGRLSEEHKAKIAESTRARLANPENHPMYGKHHSEETLRKMRGKTPWNKGKTGIYSEESRLKNAAAHKGRKASEEARRKMSLAHKGKAPWNKGLRLSGAASARDSSGGNRKTPGPLATWPSPSSGRSP